MNESRNDLYQVREFAERAGVTIRTLHHYDHIGLLKPSGYSDAGYRLYCKADMVRLQQILTLKFIGFSLKQITELLHGDVYDADRMLRLQRDILEERRAQMDRAIRAVTRAIDFATAGAEPGWEVFENIIRAITMENNKDWMKRYYTDEQLAALDERAKADPDAVRAGQEVWAVLIKEVEASVHEDPAGEHARSLLARWNALVEQFTQGDPGITESLRKLYADQENRPATFTRPYGDDVADFMDKVRAAARS